jgi:germacradienol/geosmin synthase
MPVHDLVFPLEPINAVERGLADLWSRTAPNAGVDWFIRFRERNTNLKVIYLIVNFVTFE